MAIWTDQLVGYLRQLHGAGHSAAVIASALGNGLTRNAVLGKCHRMELRSARPTKPPKPASIKRRMKHQAQALRFRPFAQVSAPVEPAMQAPSIAIFAPPSLDLAIVELRESQCRFAVTDCAPHRFCGCRTESANLPWCPHHLARVYDREPRERTGYRSGWGIR